MKRFMKSCGIAALVLIVVGLTLGMAGRTAVDEYTMRDVLENVTGGWFGMKVLTRGNCVAQEIGIVDEVTMVQVQDYARATVYEEADTGYDMGVKWWERDCDTGDICDFDDDYAVLKGDVPMYCPGVNIRKLDIEVESGSFMAVVSDDNNVYLEASGMDGFQCYVKDGTLYIRSAHSLKSWHDHLWSGDSGMIILYLPENYWFDEVEIEVGAGMMTFEELGAAEASLEVGAGSIELNNGTMVQDLEVSVGAGMVSMWEMTVTNLEVEVGMGEFSADGIVNGHVDVECAMGSVSLGLAGHYGDFNYTLEGALGNIQLGNNFYGGFGQEMTINNGAGKDMDIECAMGSVAIWFMD